MRRWLSWGLYPSLLFGGVGLAGLALERGAPLGPVVVAAVGGSTLVLLAAQRLLPAEPSWRGRPVDFGLDLLHLLSTGLSTELWRLLSLGMLYQAAGALSSWAGGSAWPGGLPLLAQLPLALLLGELGAYWLHRACHRHPLLWRIHALHHSSERMYVLAAGRNHPANAILMHACHVVPLALLGAPPALIGLTGVFTGVHGLLQHCNADLRHGPLNLLFATAEAHRWHHSAAREEGDCNFGNNLCLWDRCFGTWRLPEGRPASVGLGASGRSLPGNFLGHLALPLFLHRWLREDTQDAGGEGAVVDLGMRAARSGGADGRDG